MVFRVAEDLLVFFTAVTCWDCPIGGFIFSRCIAAEVALVFSSDVVLGFDSGMALCLGSLRPGVFLALPVMLDIVASWFTICMNVGAEVFVMNVILGDVR